MSQYTSYSIRVEFLTGIKKRWGLPTAYSTFRHWSKNTMEKWMPDNKSIKDAKKLLEQARKLWPKYDFKIIKTVTKTTVLDY